MTAPLPGLATLFRWACGLDVAVRKAGNVSRASPGHGMSAALFEASAQAAAEPLCEPGAPIGRRIEGAVTASLGVAQCNTNLGIVLLCAPLLAAAERTGPVPCSLGDLREGVRRQLLQLDVEDSRCAYRAITAAKPGGLGHSDAQDVQRLPTIGLREAMALAADRDCIAREYAQAFPLVLGPGIGCFLDRSLRAWSPRVAMLRTYLHLLSTVPDSHIVRKYGAGLAHSVMAEARPWAERADEGEALEADVAYAAWDTSLKERGINPGTSADLSVASALSAALVDLEVHRQAQRTAD